MPKETRDKILEAAMELMSVKGYSGSTTKEIAKNAGISEMTLFRKYSTKQDILDAMIEKYTSSFRQKKVFAGELAYDLEIDLANVSRTYQTFMDENRMVVLLAFKEFGVHNEISERLTANPILMKKFLIDYLNEMKRRDLIIDVDTEVTVMSFMLMNLGYISSQFISVDKVGILPIETFIEHSVKVFARGLRKK